LPFVIATTVRVVVAIVAVKFAVPTVTGRYALTAPSVKFIEHVVSVTAFKCIYVALATVCGRSIVYVPAPPVPVPSAVIVPPTAVFSVIPIAIVPLSTPVTVSVFAAIVPYTTASPVTATTFVGVGGGHK
jgi:hypothetical protein